MEKTEKFFKGMLVFLFIFVGALIWAAGKAEEKRKGLYEACLADKQPAYACYGFIYGGGVRR